MFCPDRNGTLDKTTKYFHGKIRNRLDGNCTKTKKPAVAYGMSEGDTMKKVVI